MSTAEREAGAVAEHQAGVAGHQASAVEHQAGVAEHQAGVAEHQASAVESPHQTGAEAQRRALRRTGPLRVVGRAAGDAALALSFLTVLPMPAQSAPRRAAQPGAPGPALSMRPAMQRTAAWFALVGGLVGALAGGVRVAAQPLLGALPASALALVVLVGSSGALHQDGLADTADGLGARGDAARRLAAMRDPAVGVFGVVALIWWGLLMVSVLASLSAHQALRALVLAGAISRWGALVHARAAPPAREEGLGATFHARAAALVAGGAVALGAAVWLCGAYLALGAITAGVAVAVGTAMLARRTLGGRTGDTLGASVALAELAVCLVLSAAWHG